MSVKTIVCKMNMADASTICTIYKELTKLPCMFKYKVETNELFITGQTPILYLAQKVVNKYV